MKTLICDKTGKTVTLEKKIGGGGEGEIWRTNQRGRVAKIYKGTLLYKELYPESDRQKKDSEEKDREQELNNKIEKLKVMIDHPPSNPYQSKNHISYAWPESLLKDENQIVGFLMPKIKGAKEFLEISNIKARKDAKFEINWRFLHVTAMHLANLIRSLHAEGYVVGDMKPDNIMVNSRRALPSIVDTDSFQLRDPKRGKLYRCPVLTSEFTPPELIGENIAEVDQRDYHDAFRLGELIYLLLTSEAYYQGLWCGSGEPPEAPKKIREGLWPYGGDSSIKPSDRTMPLEVMHPRVRELFLRCFNDGHNHPSLRPTADDWFNALREAVNDLIQCDRVETHIYAQHYGRCYWCERAWKLKTDAFPPMSGYQFYDPTKTSPYDDQREYEKTLADDNQAISKLNPKLAEACNNRGVIYYEQGKYEKAIAEYNQAIQVNPKYFEAYCNRGVIYYEQGKYEKAIADCNQAIQLNPKDAGVYYNRGLTYKTNRNIEKAISDFEKAAELYKQQANQEWYQNSLDELKGLSRPKPSSTFSNYPSTSKKRQPKTSIKSSSSPLLSFFVGVSGFLFPWSLRFLVLVSSFTGIIAMFLARSALALLPFVGIGFVCSLLLGVIFNRWNFCRYLSMWMLGWGTLLGLGYGLYYLLIGIFAGSKLIASGFIYFCFGCASITLASFLIDRWGWKN